MSPESIKKIAELFRQRRQRQGWSTRQLAERTQLHASTITRLEQGVFKTPSPETIERIAIALGIAQAELAAISARYVLPADLPDFDHYLQVKYPELSTAARGELLRRFEQLRRISREVTGWDQTAA